MKKVTRSEDVPTKPHYVVMVYTHTGYDTTVEHWITEDADDWKSHLTELYT